MVRYLGPKLRIQRRLGKLFSLAKSKKKFRKLTPGEHAKKTHIVSKRSSISSGYKERLIEKQKLRFSYGITENQLYSYYCFAKKKKTNIESVLFHQLESRLDNIVYRLGFSSTLASARQYVTHGHILVNNHLVNIPSFLCSKDDQISIKKGSKIRELVIQNIALVNAKNKHIQEKFKHYEYFRENPLSILPRHLSLDTETLIGKIVSNDFAIDLKSEIDSLKIIEYYSR